MYLQIFSKIKYGLFIILNHQQDTNLALFVILKSSLHYAIHSVYKPVYI